MYYFANWKTYQTFDRIKNFIKLYTKSGGFRFKEPKSLVGIAPSYEQLWYTQKACGQSKLLVGAQDCSSFLQGAYTGQVSVPSLQEMQIAFCIVGHTEARRYLQQSPEEILQKFKLLVTAGISPILCIGETLEQKKAGQTFQVLYDELEAVLLSLQQYQGTLPIFISYEPVYAIGTGVIPSLQELQDIYSFLEHLIQNVNLQGNISLLYGGSVSSQTVGLLKTVDQIDGFLIGKASIDFQELKKIVES
jgi:triosephosphate isomerase